MILTIDTTIAFQNPEEDEWIQKFMEDNDMGEWEQTTATGMICFHKHDIYMTGQEES